MALATSSGDAWSRFAQKIKALSMNFPETRFSDQEIPRKFVELVRKVAILITLISVLGSDCVHRTFTRRPIDFWSRFALQTTTLPTKFPETRCSNQENFKKDRGTGQEKFEFRPSWYRYDSTALTGPTGRLIKWSSALNNFLLSMMINRLATQIPVKFRESRGEKSRNSNLLRSWWECLSHSETCERHCRTADQVEQCVEKIIVIHLKSRFLFTRNRAQMDSESAQIVAICYSVEIEQKWTWESPNRRNLMKIEQKWAQGVPKINRCVAMIKFQTSYR